MSRNSLTKPSNCSRTQHEHGSPSFDPRGARAEEGQGVGCWERWRVGTSCCAGKKRVACAFSNPAEQKKSHWTVPAPALLSPLMQPSVKAPQQSSPSPGTESSNPARSSEESANFRSLKPWPGRFVSSASANAQKSARSGTGRFYGAGGEDVATSSLQSN